jgi:hypothetical protein
MRHLVRVPLALVLVVVLAACATTPIGKAIQSGEGAKLAVESAADEVIRLHLRKQISDADYVKARSAYEHWARAQKVYAEAVVAWSRSKTAQADARVQAALTNLANTITAAAEALCAFKDKSPVLATACTQLGR